MTNILDNKEIQASEPKFCIRCNEEIGFHNTATEAGRKEIAITQICEVCFDNVCVDMESGIDKLDKNVVQMIMNIDSLVLAGGAMRSLISNDEISDYDLFLIDSHHKESIKSNIVKAWENSSEGKIIFKCPQGKLYTFMTKDRVKIQLIDKRPYKDCDDLVNSFDFTACSAAWDGQRFYKHRRFAFDVINKRLNINSIQYPVATLKRMGKYQLKGYSLTSQAALDLVEMISARQWGEDEKSLYID